jgi:ABC-2 type transport system ATP-binding protein
MAGEIFGLIGPDGAGKTSVFQILGGVMPATAGTTKMCGVSARDARPFVGYLTQTFSLYQDMTVTENLNYIGELRRLERAQIEERGMYYLRMFDMERFADRLAGSLSGGMKQKLALACALVAEPRVLLLDEPTTGVDPVSRREFWKLLSQFLATGITIIMSTPYLDEAERCTRVALLDQGRLLALDAPDVLRRSLAGTLLEVAVNDPRSAQATLKSRGLASQVFGDRLHVWMTDAKPETVDAFTRLAAADVGATHVRPITPSLEDVYIERLAEIQE